MLGGAWRTQYLLVCEPPNMEEAFWWTTPLSLWKVVASRGAPMPPRVEVELALGDATTVLDLKRTIKDKFLTDVGSNRLLLISGGRYSCFSIPLPSPLHFWQVCLRPLNVRYATTLIFSCTACYYGMCSSKFVVLFSSLMRTHFISRQDVSSAHSYVCYVISKRCI